MKLENQINKIISNEIIEYEKSPFSSGGFDEYLNSITSYTIQLFKLAEFLSKKQGLDNITKSIVKKSAEKIHKTINDKLLNIVLSIAGLLLGSSISHLITLINSDNQISIESLIFITIAALIGAFLFGYYLFR